MVLKRNFDKLHSTQAFQAAGSSHLFKLLIKDIYQRMKTIQTRKSTLQNNYYLFTHGANFVRLSLIILRYMVCLFVFIRKTSKRLKRSNPIDVIMVSRMIEIRLKKSIITNRKICKIFSCPSRAGHVQTFSSRSVHG